VADQTVRHDRHEVELVAAHAAGEATGAELDRAQELIDTCDRCLELARDLRALALGLQALPNAAAVAAAQRAPRDFRITAEQAERLRPAAPAARWATRLSRAVASFGRPMGASLATLGVVGILVGTLALGGGSPASMAIEMASQAPGAGGGDAAFGGNPQAPAPAPSKDVNVTALGPAATDARQAGGGKTGGSSQDDAAGIERDSSGASAWLFGGSVVLLIVGLGLLVVATRGRARRSDG
jgi:hypothetical protein